MNLLLPMRSRRLVWGLAVVMVMAWRIEAFPPAPHHVVYGLVRDEFGQPLQNRAEVLLETSSGTALKTQVIPGLRAGMNYRLTIPMDAGITADLYKPTALHPTVAFKVRVVIGEHVYLPLEMKGDFARLGEPAGQTRLDLTLGEDSDGDGLPDAWERALIAASGRSLSLAEVRPEADFDGDGLSNLAEYLAGTYAFDPLDGFRLEVIASHDDVAVLEFLAIRGRTYTVQGSVDLQAWQPVAFLVIAPQAEATPRNAYYATDVRVLRVEALRRGQPMQFFRLLVQ